MKSDLVSVSQPSVAIKESDERFPVHRIYCVGRNYAEHAKEMGSDPSREPPFFFSKPADAVVANNTRIPFPARTQNLHHEVELVVAIGKQGKDIPLEDANSFVFGYAVGNDLTRRDLQAEARKEGRPWDTAKGFDDSAPISAIFPVTKFGHVKNAEIWLKVNGEVRQQGNVSDLIWSVSEIIVELSTLFTLMPGDLIYTGTPAGVGKLNIGDKVEAYVDGLELLTNELVGS
ncbi:fumarylacetoacetate hydrolase family protein [Aurantivibrio infirmus]